MTDNKSDAPTGDVQINWLSDSTAEVKITISLEDASRDSEVALSQAWNKIAEAMSAQKAEAASAQKAAEPVPKGEAADSEEGAPTGSATWWQG